MDANSHGSVRVLIIEDEPNAATPVKARLEETIGAQVRVEHDFEDGLHHLMRCREYDALVLDLYLGEPYEPSRLKGKSIWEVIWKERFMPIAIHTGGSANELEPPVPEDHPFVRSFTKGSGSDAQVAQYLAGLVPFIEEMHDVGESFDRAINTVLRDSSSIIWQATAGKEAIRPGLLARSARRRVAALMDLSMPAVGDEVQAWEQYVYPPVVEDSLLTGDVLRLKDAAANDPMAYRLVLSPSCDMQMRNGKCDLDSVLVAKCRSHKDFIDSSMELSQLKSRKLRKRLESNLTAPHINGHIILPGFGPVLPDMTANMRDLELIPLTEIDILGGGNARLNRVASVDSPYRELMAWAYLIVTGRPGVPDRDIKTWAENIASCAGRDDVKDGEHGNEGE